MRSKVALILATGLLVTLLGAGCGGSSGESGNPDGATGGSSGKSGDSSGNAAKTYDPDVDPTNFVSEIDNKYFPLEPGTTHVYEGKTEDGTERIEVTATGDKRTVMGVECVVVRDQVFLDGSLIEDTFDWYAQDEKGNVWYFGENTKEYENGEVKSTSGSWEAGVDGAKPGIIMQANPKVGETYRQEYYEGEAEDMAKILSLDESATVPYGSFDKLLMTREWNPLEPGVTEQKYYAPGIGTVLEVGVKGNSDRVELIDIKKG